MARRALSKRQPDPAVLEVWRPPAAGLPDVTALKALAIGAASKDQQLRFMNWLLNDVCGTYAMTFSPLGDRASCFAEGRRYVGRSLVNLIRAKAENFREGKDDAPTENG